MTWVDIFTKFAQGRRMRCTKPNKSHDLVAMPAKHSDAKIPPTQNKIKHLPTVRHIR